MIVDGHTLQCYFVDGFCKPSTETPYLLVWFSDDFRLIFTLQDFIGRMTKIEDSFWIETDSSVLVNSTIQYQRNLIQYMALKELVSHMPLPHKHKTHITLVFHVSKYFACSNVL